MQSEEKEILVGLVDDHSLLRTALAGLINGFGGCRVTQQSSSGREFIQSISTGQCPDVAILDLNMPEMDGFETADWMRKNLPEVHVLMLTMYDSELSLIRLLQTGVRGFLKKDIHPNELKLAITTVVETGFYYSHNTTGKLVNLFRNGNNTALTLQRAMLSEQELLFLKHACSELTYKEIAQRMALNPRSIDTLRDQLFVKLDVKSRVGLAMVAIRNGVVTFL